MGSGKRQRCGGVGAPDDRTQQAFTEGFRLREELLDAAAEALACLDSKHPWTESARQGVTSRLREALQQARRD